MDKTVANRFSRLSTALVADACLRHGVPLRLAPPGIRPLVPGHRLAGRVLPARHRGSVDVFLEAFDRAQPGDVLVVDNRGRLDEACVGDLTALEAAGAGVAGMLVWGAHRDSAELIGLGVPVFSYGSCPSGPRHVEPAQPDDLIHASVGEHETSASDVVLADDDGALFLSSGSLDVVLETAAQIRDAERNQADAVRAGRSLREQFAFADYMARRAVDPSYSFRHHLRARGGAIEE